MYICILLLRAPKDDVHAPTSVNVGKIFERLQSMAQDACHACCSSIAPPTWSVQECSSDPRLRPHADLQ